MFESAELGHKLDKATYAAAVPALRENLLDAQLELLQSRKFAVVLLIGGVDGAGKGETVNLLNEWLDPRHVETNAPDLPTDEERERPPMWRFWRALPPRGKIGIFFGSWYTEPIVARVLAETRNADLDQAMDRIVRFEKMLADEGVLLLKFWLHLSRERQKKRLKKLESDPATRWRVTRRDWDNFAHYDAFRRASEHALRQTSSAEAPWTIVEGGDPAYRSLTIGQAVLTALRARLDAPPQPAPVLLAPPSLPAIDQVTLLRRLDLGQRLEKPEYNRELAETQAQLARLLRDKRMDKHSLVLVFEGVDAAGKGGAIRRITQALDARQYRIIPIAAPTEEERAQPYLWRFWRHLPRQGRVAIFDRSWYGRVLVERVEGYCGAHDWMRAYGEINDFEEQLVRNRAIVIKFWLSIDKDEQLRRFQEREQIGFKRYKITAEDWRNRDRWDDYEAAVCDMIDRTSSETAPWVLVEANDKYFARIKILRTIVAHLEAALDR